MCSRRALISNSINQFRINQHIHIHTKQNANTISLINCLSHDPQLTSNLLSVEYNWSLIEFSESASSSLGRPMVNTNMYVFRISTRELRRCWYGNWMHRDRWLAPRTRFVAFVKSSADASRISRLACVSTSSPCGLDNAATTDTWSRISIRSKGSIDH